MREPRKFLTVKEFRLIIFLPLIDETTQKIHELEPKLAQTGPAIEMMKKLKLHESLLTDEEKLKIYKTLNESIKKMYH